MRWWDCKDDGCVLTQKGIREIAGVHHSFSFAVGFQAVDEDPMLKYLRDVSSK